MGATQQPSASKTQTLISFKQQLANISKKSNLMRRITNFNLMLTNNKKWILLLIIVTTQARIASAQCPFGREFVELHSDCICDFNPSLTTGLEDKEPINRMSVQCSLVNFNNLLTALKQTASVELFDELTTRTFTKSSEASLVTLKRHRGDPIYLAATQIALQTKLDLLHVSNSTLKRLTNYMFVANTSTLHFSPPSSLSSIRDNEDANAASYNKQLIVAVQSLHLSRCSIELVDEQAFAGLEFSLVSLSLADNKLQFVPIKALARLLNLKILDLSNNKLTSIKADSFINLKRLNTLRLGDNNLGGGDEHFTQEDSRLSSGHPLTRSIEPRAFAGLEMSLVDLSLKNCNLNSLPAATLGQLTSLEFLNLAQNQIELLEPNSFINLTSLSALNLERNRISSLENNSFAGVERSLSSLSLLGNLLRNYPHAQLAKLQQIRRLDLGFNEIRTLPKNAFDANSKLFLVALDGNLLETLPESAFASLYKTLRGLSIGGKALSCDCRLSWLLEWQQSYHLQISSRERSPQFCARPAHLRTLVSFSGLKPEHFTCPNNSFSTFPGLPTTQPTTPASSQTNWFMTRAVQRLPPSITTTLMPLNGTATLLLDETNDVHDDYAPIGGDAGADSTVAASTQAYNFVPAPDSAHQTTQDPRPQFGARMTPPRAQLDYRQGHFRSAPSRADTATNQHHYRHQQSQKVSYRNLTSIADIHTLMPMSTTSAAPSGRQAAFASSPQQPQLKLNVPDQQQQKQMQQPAKEPQASFGSYTTAATIGRVAVNTRPLTRYQTAAASTVATPIFASPATISPPPSVALASRNSSQTSFQQLTVVPAVPTTVSVYKVTADAEDALPMKSPLSSQFGNYINQSAPTHKPTTTTIISSQHLLKKLPKLSGELDEVMRRPATASRVSYSVSSSSSLIGNSGFGLGAQPQASKMLQEASTSTLTPNNTRMSVSAMSKLGIPLTTTTTSLNPSSSMPTSTSTSATTTITPTTTTTKPTITTTTTTTTTTTPPPSKTTTATTTTTTTTTLSPTTLIPLLLSTKLTQPTTALTTNSFLRVGSQVTELVSRHKPISSISVAHSNSSRQDSSSTSSQSPTPHQMLITKANSRPRGVRKDDVSPSSVVASDAKTASTTTAIDEQLRLIDLQLMKTNLPPFFNKLSKFVDLDKLALIIAGLMCVAILLVALSMFCLCCCATTTKIQSNKQQLPPQLIGGNQRRADNLNLSASMLLQSGDDSNSSSSRSSKNDACYATRFGSTRANNSASTNNVKNLLKHFNAATAGRCRYKSANDRGRLNSSFAATAEAISSIGQIDNAHRLAHQQFAERNKNNAYFSVNLQRRHSMTGAELYDERSSSCDSDKTNSPKANTNNHYNIFEAHRTFLRTASCRKQEQKKQQQSLLKTVDIYQKQQHRHNQNKHCKYPLREEQASSSSSSRDSSGDCGDSRTLLNANKTTMTTTTRRAAGHDSFGVQQHQHQQQARDSFEEADAEHSQMTVRNSFHYTQQQQQNQYQHQPGSAVLSASSFQVTQSNCAPSLSRRGSYLSTELLPVSAECEWPEPYVDPEAVNDDRVNDVDEHAECIEHLHENQKHLNHYSDQFRSARRSSRNQSAVYIDNWHTVANLRCKSRPSDEWLTSRPRQDLGCAASSLLRLAPHLRPPQNSFVARGAVNWLRWTPTTSPEPQKRNGEK